jgi:DNA-binding FadR family transcriptional regulator
VAESAYEWQAKIFRVVVEHDVDAAEQAIWGHFNDVSQHY